MVSACQRRKEFVIASQASPYSTHPALHPCPGVWWSFIMLVVHVVVVIPVNSYLVERKDKKKKLHIFQDPIC